MAAKHTPGPWRIGRATTIVADYPVPEVRGSDDIDFYGGHLICESIAPQNASLIAASPDLLNALQYLLEVTDSDSRGAEYFTAIQQGYTAVAKAVCKEFPKKLEDSQ